MTSHTLPPPTDQMHSLNVTSNNSYWENASLMYEFEDNGDSGIFSMNYNARFPLYTVLAVCCILFNIVSLMAMANIRGHRTVHHSLLVNLSVCDIVGSILLWMYYNSPLIFPRFSVTSLRHCLFIVIVLLVPFLLSLCCSSLSLLMLAVNQYIAICHPLFSQTQITHGSACLCIAGVWVLSAAAASVPTFLMLFKTHFEDCSGFASDMAVKSLEVCAYVLAGLIIIIVIFYGRIYREVCLLRRSIICLSVRLSLSLYIYMYIYLSIRLSI